MTGLSRRSIARKLQALGVPAKNAKSAAETAATHAVASTSKDGKTTELRVFRRSETIALSVRSESIVFERTVDASLTLTLSIAPRTKKNGTTLGIKQTPAYRRYRDAIIEALEPFRLAGVIPLPDGEYNIASKYFVDRYGENADKVGLDQGLYDALENAGVVTDDWQFRTDDGTRIVVGDARPRVEVHITPLTV